MSRTKLGRKKYLKKKNNKKISKKQTSLENLIEKETIPSNVTAEKTLQLPIRSKLLFIATGDSHSPSLLCTDDIALKVCSRQNKGRIS